MQLKSPDGNNALHNRGAHYLIRPNFVQIAEYEWSTFKTSNFPFLPLKFILL